MPICVLGYIIGTCKRGEKSDKELENHQHSQWYVLVEWSWLCDILGWFQNKFPFLSLNLAKHINWQNIYQVGSYIHVMYLVITQTSIFESPPPQLR